MSAFESYFALALFNLQLEVITRAATGEPPLTSEEYAAKLSRAFEVANKGATTVQLALADLAEHDRRRKRGLLGWLFGSRV